jgi:hypothetical protein
VKYTDPDGNEIIVGISMGKNKNGGISKDPIGQHVFIMYIDSYNSDNNIMLDVSGHYGPGRGSDIVGGESVNVNDYLNYFNDSPEELTVFTITMPERDEHKIRDLISEVEGRSPLPFCAINSSNLLKESGLFPNITRRRLTPKGVLKDMFSFAKDKDNVEIKRYDFQTQKEIEIKELYEKKD